jgi:multicomponent Na+:H+ antiporter subunit F
MNFYEMSVLIVCVGIILTMAVMVQRIWKGPTTYDRLNALALIGTDTILLVAMIGLMTNQIDHYVDIAITYAMTGFIGLALIAKYITDRQSDRNLEETGLSGKNNEAAADISASSEAGQRKGADL